MSAVLMRMILKMDPMVSSWTWMERIVSAWNGGSSANGKSTW